MEGTHVKLTEDTKVDGGGRKTCWRKGQIGPHEIQHRQRPSPTLGRQSPARMLTGTKGPGNTSDGWTWALSASDLTWAAASCAPGQLWRAAALAILWAVTRLREGHFAQHMSDLIWVVHSILDLHQWMDDNKKWSTLSNSQQHGLRLEILPLRRSYKSRIG